MQAAKERTHAETTRREFFKLKIILIFLHHIQIIVTRIFNRIRKVTHMTRDIHDPPSFRFRFSSERILFQLARPYSIFEHEPQFGHTSKRRRKQLRYRYTFGWARSFRYVSSPHCLSSIVWKGN